MLASMQDASIYQNDEDISPPPGLGWETSANHAQKIDDSQLLVTREKSNDSLSIPKVFDEPMKVKISPASLQKVNEASAQRESIAQANEQLAWENEMLRQYSECAMAADEMQSQGWWAQQQQWAMQWSTPITQPGDLVYFHGLQSATELNGEYGTVDRWDDASERWVVRLLSGKETFAKPDNLMVVREQPTCCPEWYPHMYGMDTYRQLSPKSKSGRVKRKSSLRSEDSESTAESTAASTTSEHSGESSEEAGATSVLMRNIPSDCSGSMVLELFDEQGQVIDCFGITMGDERKEESSNVKFITPEDAERFQQHFDGSSKSNVARAKVRRARSSGEQ